jgi:hypothetical protein
VVKTLTGDTPARVWLRLALGAGVLAAAGLFAVIPGTGGPASVPMPWAPVVAFPFVHAGLVRWNRYSTNLADPHDLLNGVSAVLAVVAIMNIVLVQTGGPLSAAPWWETQALLGQLAASFVWVGTAVSLPFVGALGRDPRAWLVVIAFGAVLARDVVTVATGGMDTAWAVAADPVAAVYLCLAATLRRGRVSPQPADPRASTIGAFVVIVAATAILPARVAELFAAHAVPPESIILEITESVLLTDPDRSVAVVGALAELGLTVSIDDFGTGYSSLAYLRDLPVRELKPDRSFTTDLPTDDRTGAIVASTIDLAHQLGLRVVAERMEQEETLRHLAALGAT